MAARNIARAGFACEFETPKKFLLRGLWFGKPHAKTVFIFLHGLSGSAFSMGSMLSELVGSDRAVLSFNNRGFEWITTLRKGKSGRIKGGAAHEVFTECVDDIDGAIRFAKKQGAKRIFLVGHSTGCQKSMYWASKRGRGVKGVILLGPISDYEAELHKQGKAKIARAISMAHALISRGDKHELLPSQVWHERLDAQRFLSLYSTHSAENTFPYGRPSQRPRALESVRTPVLVFWAKEDEYADRPSEEIAAWFEEHIRAPHRIEIVDGVGHGFKGAEKKVANTIRAWISGNK